MSVMCRMFEGTPPPDAVAVQAAAAEDESAAPPGWVLAGMVLTEMELPGLSVLYSCEVSFGPHRLPDDLNRSRRTAALQALPLLFKLLGGDGITWKGVHRPIMDKVRRG